MHSAISKWVPKNVTENRLTVRFESGSNRHISGHILAVILASRLEATRMVLLHLLLLKDSRERGSQFDTRLTKITIAPVFAIAYLCFCGHIIFVPWLRPQLFRCSSASWISTEPPLRPAEPSRSHSCQHRSRLSSRSTSWQLIDLLPVMAKREDTEKDKTGKSPIWPKHETEGKARKCNKGGCYTALLCAIAARSPKLKLSWFLVIYWIVCGSPPVGLRTA